MENMNKLRKSRHLVSSSSNLDMKMLKYQQKSASGETKIYKNLVVYFFPWNEMIIYEIIKTNSLCFILLHLHIANRSFN